MANRTITAYVEHLNIAIREALGSQSNTQIVGVFPFDKLRQDGLVAAALKLLEVPVCDTPETHPEPAP